MRLPVCAVFFTKKNEFQLEFHAESLVAVLDGHEQKSKILSPNLANKKHRI
jgi:hypothetical protein